MISCLNSNCFRILGFLLSAVTKEWKVKSYQTILNVKYSQKVFDDVNFKVLKVLKNEMLNFNWNIRIYSNIRIYLNIRIYSNMFYTIRIYSYSYSDENFLNEYIRIRIRSWKKYSLISDMGMGSFGLKKIVCTRLNCSKDISKLAAENNTWVRLTASIALHSIVSS